MAIDATTPEELQMFLDSFPINRFGTPEGIGDLVVLLCSGKPAYITGVSIGINGWDLMI